MPAVASRNTSVTIRSTHRVSQLLTARGTMSVPTTLAPAVSTSRPPATAAAERAPIGTTMVLLDGSAVVQGEDELSGVLTSEEHQQDVGEVIDAAGHDVLPCDEPAVAEPLGELGQRLRVPVPVVEYQHARHGSPCHQQRQIVSWAPHLLRVVLRYRAADDDPGAAGKPGQNGVEDISAHVVEVDVDTTGRVLAQRFSQVLVLVVDRRVEAELPQHAALVLATGDADDATAFELCDLAGDAAHGA